MLPSGQTLPDALPPPNPLFHSQPPWTPQSHGVQKTTGHRQKTALPSPTPGRRSDLSHQRAARNSPSVLSQRRKRPTRQAVRETVSLRCPLPASREWTPTAQVPKASTHPQGSHLTRKVTPPTFGEAEARTATTGDHMQTRYGKWFADWRDAAGTRRRKAFSTKQKAQKYQDKMQSEASSKKARARAASAISPAPGARAGQRRISTHGPRHTSAQRGRRKHRTPSHSRKSST